MRLNRVLATSIMILAFISIVFTEDALPFSGATHRILSNHGALNSVLKKDNYLVNYLGFQEGLGEVFKWQDKKQSVTEWMQDGAVLEDEGNLWDYIAGKARSLNHFHDPLKEWGAAGLSDIFTGESSLLWAQDGSKQSAAPGGDWSWQKTRDLYYAALTTATDAGRQQYFAMTFRGLGDQMHLIQDMGVPDHARNDTHPEQTFPGSNEYGELFFEPWAAENDIFITQHAQNSIPPTVSLNTKIDNYVPITQFTDTNKYDGKNPSTSTGIGLSEYTNANFFSDDTRFAAEEYPPGDRHYFPYPKRSSTNIEKYWDQLPETKTERDGVKDLGFWIAKDKDGEEIEHFLKPTYHTYDIHPVPGEERIYYRIFYRDEVCHADYASKLIPRAVGYSAGLLDYFFRGTLEITSPQRFVYALIDGSDIEPGKTQQEFKYIKANVRNTTPDEQMQNGIIQAVARYKKRIDYQPDLSADPPTAVSREADFSYSVSAPIEITSLSSTEPTEFTFDFTQNPIPVGITDLYLQVIFMGTLGQEDDIAIAVGMKDLNEPMHICLWNCTDRFYLDGVLRTGQEIRDNPSLLARVDFDGDGRVNEVGIGEPYIDPHDVDTKVAFYLASSGAPAYYHASYDLLPPGRYGRVIILIDQSTLRVHIHRASTNPYENMHSYLLFPGVVNQEDSNGVFHNSSVTTFREIIQHSWSAYSRYYPYATGISTAPWPGPVDIDPYPVTTINP